MALRTRPAHRSAIDPIRRLGRAMLAAVVPLAAVLLPGTPAVAAPDTSLTWSVRPTPTEKNPQRPNFAHDLAPGQRIEDSIRVRNFGNKALPLTIYSSDALNTSSGALDLLPAGTPPTDVGKWIVLGKAAIEVPANGHVDVPFTMVVPSAAEPGDHTGGIVTSYRSPGTDDKGRAVVIDRRLGTRMYVRVAGALRPELTVSDVRTEYQGNTNPLEPGDVRVSYTVTNTGNVRIGAEQSILVPGGLGLPGREALLDPMPELLPDNSLDFSFVVSGVWPTFRTTATIELRPAATRQGEELAADVPVASASAATWSVPWPQLVVLLVVAGLVLYVMWRVRRRRRRQTAVQEQAVQIAAIVRETVQAVLTARPDIDAPAAPAPTTPPAPSVPPVPSPASRPVD